MSIGIIINLISSSYKILFYLLTLIELSKISDHQQGWGDENGPLRGTGHLCWGPLI
jgi:hypothetical protein